ncbi:MAG: rhodanese-like domain-containing protein [bacterium]|jgi:rhodanese-related sulfurtransferase|nr:rhodanese-like domain-containing protein [candidate division KSB1 bacterium]MDH7560932.1 rhodanese-like domain-containing protein [bacterium]
MEERKSMAGLLPSRQTLVQAALLVVLAVVVGLAWNVLWPKGVAIRRTRPRPPIETPAPEGETVLSDIALGGGEPGSAAGPRLYYVTLSQLDTLRAKPGVVLLDARAAESFARAHIPGAVSLPADEVWQHSAQVAKLAQAQLALIYCDDPRCDMAERLADELLAHGLRAIAIYGDGLRGWMGAGRPVARGDLAEGGRE